MQCLLEAAGREEKGEVQRERGGEMQRKASAEKGCVWTGMQLDGNAGFLAPERLGSAWSERSVGRCIRLYICMHPYTTL